MGVEAYTKIVCGIFKYFEINLNYNQTSNALFFWSLQKLSLQVNVISYVERIRDEAG